MKKVLLALLILSLAVGSLIANGGSDNEAAAPEMFKPVKITWSSVSVPNDAHTKAMQMFKLELERISGGEMEVELYHSGQLFTQEGAQAAVIRGTLDMVYSDAPWVAQQVPYVSMLGAVYAFTGYEHMTTVMNGPIGQEIFDDVVEQVGIRPLGAFYLGTRQLNLRDIGREVRHPDDMEGVKLRTPNSPAWIALGKALGGNPTPMSFTEVYMALKTGTADGQDNPLPTDKNAKFYEVTKYIILTDHVVGAIWPTINEEKWQSFTAQQQQWVMEALAVAQKLCDETNLAAEAELVDFFRNEGLTVIEDADLDAFAEYAKWSYQNESPEVSSSWDWELYDRIQAAK
jgi:tripartite ATP-independent transporter DctP family solute receptor